MATKRDGGDFDELTDPSGEWDFAEENPADRIPTAVGHKKGALQLDEPFEEEVTGVFFPDEFLDEKTANVVVDDDVIVVDEPQDE